MSDMPPLTGDRRFQDDIVRIATLTVNNTTIDGYAFVNCRIIGPAVLAFLQNVTVTHSGFDAPGLDAVFWVVPPERGVVVGVVGVSNCLFSRCTFEGIGIAGPPELLAQFEADFTNG